MAMTDLAVQAARAKQVRAIRWLDLSWAEFQAWEARLTTEEFQGMGLIQRREYEEAKFRKTPASVCAHTPSVRNGESIVCSMCGGGGDEERPTGRTSDAS